jgi:hypothetical protein
MTALPANSIAPEATARKPDEIDVWWGSYAGRAMAPSFAVCLVLTALIYFGARWWVPERGWLQLTFSGMTSIVWLVQLLRWAHRFFTWNYRLTTRFLYVDSGLKPLIAQRFPVRSIERVEVHSHGLQKWLRISDLWVWLDAPARLPVVLQAIASPRPVAEMIREVVRKARENIN